MKRVITVLMIAFVLMGAGTIIGFADSNETIIYRNGITGGEIFFDKSTGMVTHYRGNVTSIVIPDMIDGARVKGIDDRVFEGCTSLKKVDLGDSMESIGKSAFSECSALKTINMGSALKSIGNKAFYDCHALNRVIIPDSVRTMGEGAFSNCSSLRSAKLPDGIRSLDDSLFEECSSLKSIAIPDSVNTLGDSVFYMCSSLEKIQLDCNLEQIGDWGFSMCSSLINIDIPAGVTTVGKSVFAGCHSLRRIVIPDTVQTIDSYAFHDCRQLRKVKIPGGVKEADRFFDGCSSLKSIEIPSSVVKFELERPLNESEIDYDKLIIYGERGSEAQAYAKMYNIAFIVGKMPETEDISQFNVSVSSSKPYTGKAIYSSVNIDDDGYDLMEGQDYTVSYSNNIDPGTATVSINGINDYEGAIQKTFRIYIRKMSKPSVTKVSKSYVKVSWNTLTGVSGYQIAKSSYSTRGFKVVKSVSSKSKTVKLKVKRNKKYYYKVRAYKTVNQKKIYGSWSSAKSYKLR